MQIASTPGAVPMREAVAATVRAELARRRMSQMELAAGLGRSQAWVSRRLSGAVSFDVDDLAAVADLLGVPLSIEIAA